ncbi:hypothetical protein CO705_18935 [Ralstonia pickettii]|nr:hypothetical protein CO705_18935 [Ralstonia pickettii]
MRMSFNSDTTREAGAFVCAAADMLSARPSAHQAPRKTLEAGRRVKRAESEADGIAEDRAWTVGTGVKVRSICVSCVTGMHRPDGGGVSALFFGGGYDY